jgi:hypothetical protein
MSNEMKPNKDVLTFEAWLAELTRIKQFSGYTDDPETMRPAYDDGLTPAEAVLQDISYA